MQSIEWEPAPKRATLEPYDLHIWLLQFQVEAPNSWYALLSEDEKARANRFHFSEHRHKFIQGRGGLRLILAWYLGIDPAIIRFTYNQYGKPALPKPYDWLEFNLSHTADLAVYAINKYQVVGIDLEYINRTVNLQQIARHFFASQEVHSLFSLPEAQQLEGFFNCWTRKEAFIKACGQGLSIPLNSFAVSLIPGATPRLLLIEDSEASKKTWRMVAFSPQTDYIGAVVVRGQVENIYYWAVPRKFNPLI